jgi:predicted nucleic acid-binding protein
MADFVLDASVALTWCFEDETHPLATNLLNRLRGGASCMVPPVWPLEVANAVRMAERRRRITADHGAQFLVSLSELPIYIVSLTISNTMSAVMQWARQYDLTVYDASYLSLAIEEELPLATFDRKLQEAARQAGVSLVEA